LNQKQKWMLAAGLSALSAAVWIPQLLARSGTAETRSASADMPAFPGAPLDEGAEFAASDGAVAPGTVEPPDTSASGALERLTELERLLPRLRNYGVARPRPALDQLLSRAAARPQRTSAATAAATPAVEPAAAALFPSTSRERSPADEGPDASSDTHPTPPHPLAEFLLSARLSACLVGVNGSSAVLNGRVVRPGDQLAAAITVETISARHIVLRWNDERAELALSRGTPRPRDSGSAASTSGHAASTSNATPSAPLQQSSPLPPVAPSAAPASTTNAANTKVGP
jgi:hypothetical protein